MRQLDLLVIGIRMTEQKVRDAARKHGIKVRRHRYSGVDAIFPDGTKKHFHGWKHAYNELSEIS